MLRIRCEFNERLPDGGQVALFHEDGRRLDSCAAELGLVDGQRVRLVDVEGDFEVDACLREQPSDPYFRWVADPGRSTRNR
ncbi:MAG: hypothetical protein IT534_12395 [Bauldia sp.]|jgi:hypothetical protein|nr:hypothetical protein [Bauldia sp.]